MAGTMDGQPPTSRPGGGRSGTRVSLACAACRSRHLKCDAAVPSCARCVESNKECEYKVIKGRRRLARLSPDIPPQPRQPDHEDSLVTISQDTHIPGSSTSSWQSLSSGPAWSASEISGTCLSPQDTGLDECLRSYYANFHAGHPFVLPHGLLLLRGSQYPESLARLLAVMRFIGAMYIGSALSAVNKQQCSEQLSNIHHEDGFTVQFFLLFAIALEWSDEVETANHVLARARNMALSIRMHRSAFAVQHGQSCPMMEESWRRTWWELFLIDGLFAGIRHLPSFPLWSVDYDVDLPSEEASYTDGKIPPPRSLHEYDDRAFSVDGEGFSSFAYLIDAVRMLGTTLAAADSTASSEVIESLVRNTEANVVSWELHLPATKKDPVGAYGTVDEIMFQAHMMIHTVSTHLHRPRSHLYMSSLEVIFSKFASPETPLVQAEDRSEIHTIKALTSAQACIELFVLPISPRAHTPFCMCMGAMATATHISACESLLHGKEYDQARDRIRVFIGVLKAFEHTWPQASKWLNEMKTMAGAVFRPRVANPPLVASASSVVEELSLDVPPGIFSAFPELSHV